MDKSRHLGPMRVTHLLVKFDNPSLSYSWWNLSVQCNTCCLGKNVFGWDNSHKKIKTTALHLFALMHQYLGYCICIQNNSTLSSSFQRQSNCWHGYILVVLVLHHASCVNCIFLMTRKGLLCFLSVNWALINRSIDCAMMDQLAPKVLDG
jgi:hypothetical protein